MARAKDPSKLSQRPGQIRTRLRRKGKAFEQDLAMLYKDYPVSEWDLEELARGRPRAKNGTFAGPKPKWISALVTAEAKRRLIDDVYGMLGTHVAAAVRVMGELLVSEEVDANGKPIVDAKTKFAAAAFIIEHMIGKPESRSKMTVEIDEPKQAIAAAIVLDDGLPQGHLGVVIEGETVEDPVEVDDDEDYEEIDDDDDSE